MTNRSLMSEEEYEIHMREYNAKYQRENSDAIKAQRAKYRAENVEKIKRQQVIFRKQHRSKK